MWILLKIEIWDAAMKARHRILRIEIGDWLVLNVIYESDSNVSTFENWDLRLVVLIITYTSFTLINTSENWDLRLASYKSTEGFKIVWFLLVTTYTVFTIHETFEIWDSRWACS